MASKDQADVHQLATQVACSVFEKELNLRKAFSGFDTDGDGTISKEEFAATVGRGVSDAVFDLFDSSADGKISSKEFQEALFDYGGGAAAPPPRSAMKQPKQPNVSFNSSPASSPGTFGSSARNAPASQSFPNFEPPERSKAARHAAAIEDANAYEYEEVDGETMTDAEVMDALSDRLEEEGVPLHKLFKVLCTKGSNGHMHADTLRTVVEKMGLGYTLATSQAEAAARRSSPGQHIEGGSLAGGGAATSTGTRGGGSGSPHSGERPGTALQSGTGDTVERQMGMSSSLGNAEEVLRTGSADDDAMVHLLPLIKAKCYERGFETGEVGKLWLALSPDRRNRITPRAFFEKLREWGVGLSIEQCCKLIDPFDVDYNGTLDFNEFAAWVALWNPPEGAESFSSSWRRGGPTDRRVWAASGAGSGKLGRLGRLMQMIDSDHDGSIQVFEFVRALARGDDYDRAFGGDSGGGGSVSRSGRLNPDGSLKNQGPSKEELEAEMERERQARSKTEQEAALAETARQARLQAEASEAAARFAGREARLKAKASDALSQAALEAQLKVEADAATAEARLKNAAEDAAAAARLLVRIAAALREGKSGGGGAAVNQTFSKGLAALKNGLLESPADLRSVMSKAGIYDADDAADAASLFRVHGEGGGTGKEFLHVWKLFELLGEHGGEDQQGEDIAAVPERPPRLRKKVVVREELPPLISGDELMQNELAVALAAERLSPSTAHMSAAELRRVQMNDNALIKQMRAELGERSNKMKDMFRRMDVDGNGTISLLEFRKGLQRSGFHDRGGMHLSGLDRDQIEVSVEDTVRLFNYFDKDGDGLLSSAEFMRLLQNTVTIQYCALTVRENEGVVYSGAAV